MENRLRSLVERIYGGEDAPAIAERLESLIGERFSNLEAPASQQPSGGRLPLDERDAFLITYGDQFRREGVPPLETLGEFASRYLRGALTGVHVLPFFPFTSDDGFSISDYTAVNPELGSWREIERLAGSFKLMSDLVLNHCSVSHPWFKGFLADDPRYRDYFITVPEGADLSMVVRPRALPLLTSFETPSGTKRVWTTFSADQVDLNYANPDVLLEMISVFFEHVSRGVQVIRLDAIAYLWKEIGHPCIHHPKTHAVVKLFRALAERYAPWVVIITETNVPHEENLSYFGNGGDEAHMIYQFSLPPLVLDAFLREDADHLRTWAASLPTLDGPATYFNFLASHDGVGLLPAHGILTPEQLDGLVESVKQRGGMVSYKATPDGEIPYELNISYADAVAERSLDEEARARKFLASQSFLLSLAGVPGIYVHSLVGSGNYREGVEETGRNRTINREKLSYPALASELDREGSFRNLVYRGYTAMLRARRRPAFHPLGTQEMVPATDATFALLRRSQDGMDRVLCAVNTGHNPSKLSFEASLLAPGAGGGDGDAGLFDLISGQPKAFDRRDDRLTVALDPWQVVWLKRA